MSKRQEKIQENIAKQQEFIGERRAMQLDMLEQAYMVGLKIYEDNKDKLSPEEIEKLEAMKADQLETLERLRNEFNPKPKA